MFISSSGENTVLVEKICKSGFYHREYFENCEKIGGKLLNFYIIKNTDTVIYTYINENGSEYRQCGNVKFLTLNSGGNATMRHI